MLEMAQSPGTLKTQSLGEPKKPKGHLLASCVLEIAQSPGTLKTFLLGVPKKPKVTFRPIVCLR